MPAPGTFAEIVEPASRSTRVIWHLILWVVIVRLDRTIQNIDQLLDSPVNPAKDIQPFSNLPSLTPEWFSTKIWSPGWPPSEKVPLKISPKVSDRGAVKRRMDCDSALPKALRYASQMQTATRMRPSHPGCRPFVA